MVIIDADEVKVELCIEKMGFVGVLWQVWYERWDWCVTFYIRDGIVLSLKSEVGLCSKFKIRGGFVLSLKSEMRLC